MLPKAVAYSLLAILPALTHAIDFNTCGKTGSPVTVQSVTHSAVVPGKETCVVIVADVKRTATVYDKTFDICSDSSVACPIRPGKLELKRFLSTLEESIQTVSSSSALAKSFKWLKIRNRDQALPGAVDGIDQLRQHGVPFKLVTNTSKTSTENLTMKLQKMGFNVSRDDVITSLAATRMLVERDNLKPFLILEPKAAEEFANIPKDASRPYDAVVVGLAPSCFHYDKLNEAFRILKNAQVAQRDVQLIAIHRGRYFQDTDDELSMGPGGFVAALEYASGVQAKIVGKPNKAFFETAINALPATTTASTTIVIGDDVENDLGPETDGLPIERFLVKTGKYRAGDEDRAFKTMDGVFASFAHIVPQILKRYGTL
ncbi:Haloacid dehalogenase-like hydrolase domain-containing protein 2 [Actinomortierella ambigua]|nr:Haloacid dehalogenase-like hydrolase domain-containing protein 2 [Actinomortierella ambigua]